MRLLIAASEPFEFKGLLSRAASVRPAAVNADWARAARLGGHELLLVANGAGRRRAAAAVEAAMAGFQPDVLVSTGLCGAVTPDLEAGQIVVATEVVFGEERYAAGLPASAREHRRGVVRTIDHIARTAGEKRQWRSTGAIAVEMEAAGVAERALASGLPFYCVKAVSDLADETLANDLNAAMRPDGHFDTMNILGSTLRHPLVRVTELLRLWRRSARAANYLGEFFADCRF
jgi:adenosylhomocysteine nucleosidase